MIISDPLPSEKYDKKFKPESIEEQRLLLSHFINDTLYEALYHVVPAMNVRVPGKTSFSDFVTASKSLDNLCFLGYTSERAAEILKAKGIQDKTTIVCSILLAEQGSQGTTGTLEECANYD